MAINKCDLPDADPQKVKNQLLEHELISEDLSGDTLMVEISAKTILNLDKLIESSRVRIKKIGVSINFAKKVRF